MLSAKQQRIYDYIKSHIEQHHFAPSIREIKDHLGYSSTSTVHALLERIEDKGYIKRMGPRAIQLLKGEDVHEKDLSDSRRTHASIVSGRSHSDGV